MVEINYQIVNEGIKRFSKYYPDGNDWGDAMYEYHNGDYEQSQLALQFLTENGILVPEGNAENDRLMLSNIGINIMKQFDGNIIKYLEHKKQMKRKVEIEHELEIKVQRSTLKTNRIQMWATYINIIIGIINATALIVNFFN